MPGNELRDSDSAELAFRLKAAAWSLAGGFIGFQAASLLARSPWIRIAGTVGGFLGTYLISRAIAGAAARGARAVLMPSGRSTPYRHQFSQVDALVMQARYAEAAALLEHHAMDTPDDPEPYLRLARLHRDHLRDPGRALAWYRLARDARDITPGLARLVREEMATLRRAAGPDPDQDTRA